MNSESAQATASGFDVLVEQWLQIPAWEVVAVLMSVTYLLLAVRQNRLCWIAALASTAIFTALFWQAQLLMQSALNVYYLGMAVYGWWHWGHGGGADRRLPIVRWPLARHGLLLALVLAGMLVTGKLLSVHTNAAQPYLDSLISWGAVVTTFMVARKVLENWAWWMLINSLAIALFIDRGLLPTAALHSAYLVISVFGWKSWYRHYRQQRPGTSLASDARV